jgi:hypothetical protein
MSGPVVTTPHRPPSDTGAASLPPVLGGSLGGSQPPLLGGSLGGSQPPIAAPSGPGGGSLPPLLGGSP